MDQWLQDWNCGSGFWQPCTVKHKLPEEASDRYEWQLPGRLIHFVCEFAEEIQPSDKVLDVVATDADSGTNAELTYNITGGLTPTQKYVSQASWTLNN